MKFASPACCLALRWSALLLRAELARRGAHFVLIAFALPFFATPTMAWQPSESEATTQKQIGSALAALRSLEFSEEIRAAYEQQKTGQNGGRRQKLPKSGAERFGKWSAKELTKDDLTLELEGQKVTAEAVAALSPLDNIAGLKLSRCDVDEDAFAKLSSLGGLKSLLLNNASVNDAALASISKSPSLESLTIIGCADLTDEGVAHLSQLPNLKHLMLRGASITGSGLAGLDKLERLNLHSSRALTSDFAEPLHQMTSLKKLGLHHVPVAKFYDALEEFHRRHPDCEIGGEHWSRARKKRQQESTLPKAENEK